jgi:hypothetical protein
MSRTTRDMGTRRQPSDIAIVQSNSGTAGC